MFIAELEDPDFRAFRSLEPAYGHHRWGALSGRADASHDRARCISREITIGYGMTETGPLSFQTAPEDPVDRRVETVGRVLPHTEVKVVDAGRPCGAAAESRASY